MSKNRVTKAAPNEEFHFFEPVSAHAEHRKKFNIQEKESPEDALKYLQEIAGQTKKISVTCYFKQGLKNDVPWWGYVSLKKDGTHNVIYISKVVKECNVQPVTAQKANVSS